MRQCGRVVKADYTHAGDPGLTPSVGRGKNPDRVDIQMSR